MRKGSSSSDFKDAVELYKERRIAWEDEGKRMESVFTLSSVAWGNNKVMKMSKTE